MKDWNIYVHKPKKQKQQKQQKQWTTYNIIMPLVRAVIQGRLVNGYLNLLIYILRIKKALHAKR